MASIHFYHYFLKYKEEVTDYHFEDLIDHINEKKGREKTVKINGHWLSMSAYWRPEGVNDDETLRYFWIDKSLTDNPYTGALGTSERSRVNGILYQPASCLLVPASQTLIIYQPSGSPSQNEIADYLFSFIKPTDSNDQMSILIKTISNNLTFQNLNKKFEIKKISLTVNPFKFNVKSSIPNIDEMDDSTKGILYGIQKASDALNEGKNKEPLLEMTIKKRSQKNPVNFILTEFLRESINNKNKGIYRASVVVRRPGKNKDETIIFEGNSNLLQDFPADNTITGSEAIFNILNEMFNGRRFPKIALDAGQLTVQPFENVNIEYRKNAENELSESEMKKARAENEN
ncbi:hypothetical protein [Companilactobacillus paralimentarius]|uniref:hypothetical protein n=1 Tax=Companilactobacillus paralimentarius TaxID=83526 RepID=UPI00384B7D7F